MTPETLRYLREQRGLTREELAEFLGDCSASTVNKWERNINPVPAWVEDKMLRSIPVTLPLDELYLLINEAHKSNRSAASILGESIRIWLTQQQNESKFTSQTAADAMNDGSCADSVASTSPSPRPPPIPAMAANIVPLPPPPVVATLLHAAETTHPPPVTETRQDITYQPRKAKKKGS